MAREWITTPEGKRTCSETAIPMPGGVTQKVTLMAPAVVGLPTPYDEDVVVALVNLWRAADTDSDSDRRMYEPCHAMSEDGSEHDWPEQIAS
jgi:hypothetical protein